MIGPVAGAKVMVATRPVDFRKGPDALAALVGTEYGGDPYSGVIFVFRAKRSDRIKLVWWDGTGLCLMAKRLESGGFKWPGIRDGVIRLTAAQLSALLEGLDWRRVHGPAPGELGLLADAGLVLPPQLYRRSSREAPPDLRQTGGDVFLKSAMSSGFWPRCRGRAESLR